MLNVRRLAAPAYLVGLLLILFPLLDTWLSVLPFRPGDVTWRFAAVGLFSRALVTPMLGLLLGFAVALFLDHRRLQRAIAILAGIAAFLLVVVIGLFILDALQVRAQIQPRARLAFEVASAVVLAKYGSGAIVLAAFGLSGQKTSRRAKAGTKVGSEEQHGATLLMGAPTGV